MSSRFSKNFLSAFCFFSCLTPLLQAQVECHCTDVDEEAQIHKVVERMPLFGGCYDAEDYFAAKRCAEKKMLDFIYGNLQYPDLAYKESAQGMAVVSFIVEVDGCINKIELLRDPGDGLGKEALRLVRLAKAQGIRWTPGYQNGELVRVQFNLPIRFRIEPLMETVDARFVNYKPDCELLPFNHAAFQKLDVRIDTEYDLSYPDELYLTTTSGGDFVGQIKIISAETGKVEFYEWRPFAGGSDVAYLNLSPLSPGKKKAVISAVNDAIKIAEYVFELE